MNYPTYEDIELYYEWGFYTKEDLTEFVVWGSITAEDYETLTGEPLFMGHEEKRG
ncbi:XkdX family protein [Listeria fleischmannii]|uniref:Phage uncharacterized protein, XkdX family n=1 Tax=Listeria fleischmannii subsp. fleischmannii TaxID=1671902 RepID=A0A2X3JC03_9LIST|nr:XkdX family protein [Listeria fleischmannii]EMG27086.1 hypothetical protein LFLEISCH_13065 [Listeria fleischmannii subsp. fleischmannii LU2006-1]SQC70609.1 phage uncharacterized protein, XkdX family [Listeria fleischmannii subsp. fleischmannii]